MTRRHHRHQATRKPFGADIGAATTARRQQRASVAAAMYRRSMAPGSSGVTVRRGIGVECSLA